MRESNFAFPAQNKACVCINSQLYDRRALDTTAPLPLTNSLQHLQYLTSTSPRIREIMTMDGGLERLITMLWDFCLSPPPPENPTVVYGLTPSGYHPQKLAPTLNPTNFDKHAAYRFSLAFQCVVNIGVRGSEPIRSRVVQAGALDVVGCVLEAWLASKGFAIGPSSSATGIPRESREQRQARRLAQAEQRQREEAAALARALQRQVQYEQLQQRLLNEQIRLQRLRNVQAITIEGPFVDEFMDLPPHRTRTRPTPAITGGRQGPNSSSDSEPGTDASITTVGSAVIVNVVRDRSGTIVARPAWDEPALPSPMRNTTQRHTHATPHGLLSDTRPQQASLASEYRRDTPSPSASTDTSRAETETEDEPEHDADGDINMNRISRSRLANRSTSTATPRRGDRHLHINAALNAGQRPQLDLPVYPHSHALSSGSTPASASASPSPERTAPAGMRNATRQPRFGPLGDRAAALAGVGDRDAHIIISDAASSTGVVGESLNMAMGVGVEGVGVAGVEDGMESLQANDDFAMGAPPGAPGAIVLDTASVGIVDESGEGTTPRNFLGEEDGRMGGLLDSNSTPRAGVVDLPDMVPMSAGGLQRDVTVRARRASAGEGSSSAMSAAAAAASTSRAAFDAESVAPTSGTGMNVDSDIQTQTAHRAVSAPEMAAAASSASTATNASVSGANGHGVAVGVASTLPPGPYKDEDVLLGLQLLAYLSKYPHVRQAFYKPRASFHPASLGLHQANATRQTEPGMLSAREREKQRETAHPSATGLTINTNHGFFRALAGRGRAALNSAGLGGAHAGASSTGAAATSSAAAAATTTAATVNPQPRQTNVFSLVERFTFKPSSNEADLLNPPPRLPAEIQYWAGVIMRNACRKDDSRGGIRQCANMLCGRWEQYPREFAKCRRCRKAKYCGKECQSTAWSEGHRFWCSARDTDEDGGDRDREGHHRPDSAHQLQAHMQVMDETGEIRVIPNGDNAAVHGLGTGIGASQVSPRAERAARRERERDRRLRELGHDIAQRPHGFVIDPMYVPVTIARRAVLLQAAQTHLVPISPTDPLQRTGPVAGPSGVMMTEAAVQHQQRLQDHHHRIVDSDWLYVAPPRAQTEAGPSRNSWHADVSGDESDMILG